MQHMNTNHPLVTVIIPTFDRAWCLARAVKSVLEQTHDNIELIVVNDGSTDNTLEILAPFLEKTTIISQARQGVSAARNVGIQRASGDLISFLDSDDLWLPDKIACQVDFFQKNPDALICQTEEIWIRKGIRVNPKKKHKKLQGMIFKPSLHLCLVSPSAVMMRRSLFDTVGLFDEELPACEDYDLWLRVAARYPIHLLDKPGIIKHGGHPDQLSAHHSLDKYRILSLTKLLKETCLTREQRGAAEQVLLEKARIYGQGCIKRGKIEEGNHYLNL